MIIGITGCPGSGKTLLARSMAEQDWELVDADEMGREVVKDDPQVLEKLALAFGADIVREDGSLDRRALARKAFSEPPKTLLLNGIVHPVLIERILSRISGLREENSDTVLDCALVFEWGIENICDLIVTVQAREDVRRHRLRDRDGRTPEEIEGMFAAQLSEQEKVSRADITVSNNGGPDKIEAFGRLLSELPRHFGGL